MTSAWPAPAVDQPPESDRRLADKSNYRHEKENALPAGRLVHKPRAGRDRLPFLS